jgi:hypothetical protein
MLQRPLREMLRGKNFQYTQTAPWPIFGLALACADWAQRWMSVWGHAAQEHFSLGSFTDYQKKKSMLSSLYSIRSSLRKNSKTTYLIW